LKKGKLVLCGIRPEIREMLHWTRLDRVFAIQAERPASVFPDGDEKLPWHETAAGFAKPRVSATEVTDSLTGAGVTGYRGNN
jgi:hypothetical protein